MEQNPYTPPDSQVTPANESGDLTYAGFWVRVGAAIIDTILKEPLIKS